MPTLEKVLRELEHWFSEIQDLKARQRKLHADRFIDEEVYNEQKRKMDEELRNFEKS